jgi:hypothetical protein
MIEKLLWIEGVLLLILLISPTLSFLFNNLKQRHMEILSGISSEGDKAIGVYFKQFQPGFAPEQEDIKARFKLFYNAHFGAKQFIFPLVLLVAIAGVLLYECNYFLTQSIKNSFNILEKPEAIFIFSILGAYLWVVYDHIAKWWYSDLSHRDLYWACFRFALSVPIGYAVTRIMGNNADIALAIAFFLGAFPMQTLLSFFRKFGRLKLGMGDVAEIGESELLKLQGIDGSKAERLAAEGITTICQLAYADPIRLTIRTNLGYSYLIDCISQAQLRLYTGNYQETWQKLGLRGGFEVINLKSGMESSDPRDRRDAHVLIGELANSLSLPEASIREIIWEVCNDPYMEFIYLSWTSGEEVAKPASPAAGGSDSPTHK